MLIIRYNTVHWYTVNLTLTGRENCQKWKADAKRRER